MKTNLNKDPVEKNHLLTTVLFLLFLFSNRAQSTTQDYWSDVIEVLNQSKITSPPSLKQNLFKQYEIELAQIKSSWKKDQKMDENIFFYHALSEKNHRMKQQLKNQKAMNLDMKILNHIHSQVRKFYLESFNPEDTLAHQIGHCFTNALMIHYLLLKQEVATNQIKKIFSLGNFYVHGSFWKFHVAITVHSQQGHLVLDPLHEKILSYEEWSEETKKDDIKVPYSRTRFFLTDARKFLPASGMYTKDLLMNPLYSIYYKKVKNFLLSQDTNPMQLQ